MEALPEKGRGTGPPTNEELKRVGKALRSVQLLPKAHWELQVLLSKTDRLDQ